MYLSTPTNLPDASSRISIEFEGTNELTGTRNNVSLINTRTYAYRQSRYLSLEFINTGNLTNEPFLIAAHCNSLCQIGYFDQYASIGEGLFFVYRIVGLYPIMKLNMIMFEFFSV